MPILEDDVLWAKNLQNDPTTGRPNREPIPLEQLHSGILRNQGIARPFYNQILYQQGQATLTLQSEYIAADGVLQDNLDAEILARSTADTTLQDNLDTEAATRAAADTLLQDNLDTEANTRLTTDNSLQGQIDSILATVNRLIPKVGDTWITKSTETPFDRFGVGTWSLIEGKMLIGVDGADTDFDTIGEEGGSKDHVHTANSNTTTNTLVDEHTLTVAQIPSHSHRLYGTDTGSASVEPLNNGVVAGDTNGNGVYTNTGKLSNPLVEATGGGEGHTHTAASSSTTTTTLDTVSNMNPYHVVYIWERTA